MRHYGPMLAAALSLIAGCATQPRGAYDGTDRPPSELAVLSIRGGVIVSIDGGKSVGLGVGYASGVRLLPGEHTLALDCQHHTLVAPTQFTGRFEAGHAYELTCHYQGERRFAADMKDLGIATPPQP